MKPFTVGSLFAGIGGFGLAAERAGMVVKWQCEIDDFCNKVLAKHWPDVARYKDVKEVGKHNLEPVDLICGGFPCQPHSVAGKRKGKEDDRDLWPEYLRIIKEVRPRWVVGENVPGIITTILDQVLSDLEGAGYTAETLIIPACAFNAPHKRERVFILAHSEHNGRDKAEAIKEYYEAQQKSKTWKKLRCYEFEGMGTLRNAPNNDGGGNRKAPRTHYEWVAEPDVGRMVNGLSKGMEQIRRKRVAALGNAVVPQVAEFIFRNIMEVERITNAPQ